VEFAVGGAGVVFGVGWECYLSLILVRALGLMVLEGGMALYICMAHGADGVAVGYEDTWQRCVASKCSVVEFPSLLDAW